MTELETSGVIFCAIMSGILEDLTELNKYPNLSYMHAGENLKYSRTVVNCVCVSVHGSEIPSPTMSFLCRSTFLMLFSLSV